jgi:general secretion pathway protein G
LAASRRDSRRSGAGGFTLLEIFIAAAIACVLGAIAVPAYQGYVERARTRRAVYEIRQMGGRIDAFEIENKVLPATLQVVIGNPPRDPWGSPYRYLRIAGPNPPSRGKVRKDKNLVPINSDYDLYSAGPDGDTMLPLTARASRDDIVRASDGGYVGVAIDY